MKMISLKIACLIVLTLTIHIVSSVSLIAAETLTWVYMANAEPESYEEDGIPKGVQPEIVNYLCGKLGIKVIHKFYPWARAQGIVKKGEADCMMTTPTGSRFKYAVFGKENVKPAFWNIFYNKNRADMAMKMKTLSKLDDLKQFKLLDFIGNGWTNAFMKEENGFNIHFVARLGQIPTMLSKGRADLTINSTTMINWWAKKNNVIDKIEMYSIEWPWTRFHYVVMVSRKSPWVQKGIIRALDREIKKMKEDGEWLRILKKYKNPHGLGEPFKSTLDEVYFEKGGFFKDYESYPTYNN